jgi:hypothetical protein
MWDGYGGFGGGNDDDDDRLSDRGAMQEEDVKELSSKKLSIELQGMWSIKYFVILVILGATGIVTAWL